MSILKNYLETLMSDIKNVEVEVNVSAAIIWRMNGDRKEILLIQRSADDHFPLMWECPRGKCDHGKNEKLEKCLKREVKEETGLDVEIGKFIDSFSYIADGGKRASTQYNFLCELKNPNQEVKLSKEHQDYKWSCNLSEIQLMVMPEQYKVISKSGILDFSDSDIQINKTISEDIKELDFKIVEIKDKKIIKKTLEMETKIFGLPQADEYWLQTTTTYGIINTKYKYGIIKNSDIIAFSRIENPVIWWPHWLKNLNLDAIISTIYVKPEYRSRGIAKDIIRFLQHRYSSIGADIDKVVSDLRMKYIFKELGFKFVKFRKDENGKITSSFWVWRK